MKRLSCLTAALILTAGSAATVIAADTYEIDSQHAWLAFSLNHAGWANATGSFDSVSGSITFDHEDVTASSVNVTIASSSIHTGFADRDGDLQSPDFFNSIEFPEITFVSTAIEKTGENTALITGDLTLVGVTKPIVLDAVWNGETALPWDATAFKSGFTATATLLPADFGMAKVAEYGLGPEVALTINIEAFKK